MQTKWQHAVTIVFSLLAVFSKGLSAVIQTQQTVVAAAGGNAQFSCQLLQSKDVLIVEWNKLSPDGEKNLASFHKKYSQNLNPDFRDKMEFKFAGLQNTSMLIIKVTEQDEGCYQCLFNTSEESLTARTCLQLYELHEPVVDVRESNSAEEWVVSCSATGRPAPTVTLSVSQQDLNFSQYNTVSVSNTNTTFTVTTTAVLSGSRKHSTQVGCAARVLSAPHREVMVTIPDDDDDDGGSYEKITSHSSESNFTWIIVLAVVSVVAVLVGILLVVKRDWISAVITAHFKQQNKTGDPEKTKVTLKSKQDIEENKAPLIQHENEQVRRRPSLTKIPKNFNRKASPSTAKRLFEED